jgi:hypothetical protein
MAMQKKAWPRKTNDISALRDAAHGRQCEKREGSEICAWHYAPVSVPAVSWQLENHTWYEAKRKHQTNGIYNNHAKLKSIICNASMCHILCIKAAAIK